MGQGRELDGTIRVKGDVSSSGDEVGLVALVRDPNGNVRFDDPHNVPPEVLNSKDFTPQDLEYLNTLRNQ